jgi:hypothetical protein
MTHTAALRLLARIAAFTVFFIVAPWAWGVGFYISGIATGGDAQIATVLGLIVSIAVAWACARTSYNLVLALLRVEPTSGPTLVEHLTGEAQYRERKKAAVPKAKGAASPLL